MSNNCFTCGTPFSDITGCYLIGGESLCAACAMKAFWSTIGDNSQALDKPPLVEVLHTLSFF